MPKLITFHEVTPDKPGWRQINVHVDGHPLAIICRAPSLGWRVAQRDIENWATADTEDQAKAIVKRWINAE